MEEVVRGLFDMDAPELRAGKAVFAGDLLIRRLLDSEAQPPQI